MVAAGILAAPAVAAPPTGPPNWSGLDVRYYSGPIPVRDGTLIADRTLAAGLGVPNAAVSRRILYSTPDQFGKRAVSTAEVFLPAGQAPRGGWPVIGWAHGTVGLGDGCTPSAQPATDRDAAYLSHFLRLGYAVVGTDYVGQGTPGLMSYLNGKVEAHSIVDSVKASQQMGLPLSRRWGIVGQSQGAGAAMNGARYATEFSRGSGLDYRGVVATGTPANIELIVNLAGPSFPPVPLTKSLNTYALYIFAGLRDAHPELKLNDILTAQGRDLVTKAETLCYAELSTFADGVNLGRLFTRPLSSVPGATTALRNQIMTPFTGYDRPIFLGQGLLDRDVPAPSALSLYAQLRANNQPVELHVYPNQDHAGTVLASVADSTPFLNRIFR
nr:prolyl oligopeptidase family serine peptidase [Williamsia sterculiae]